MRRVLLIVLGSVLVLGGAFVAMGQGGGGAGSRYKMVFDNAFGVVEGADFKVGGVAVGQIEKLDVRSSDARALITVAASDEGFGGLRDDAECIIAPQSLIGEYFIDCQPGTEGEPLPDGATIPVEQTESPIPPDLVVNIQRYPVRERFRIIFNELGAGLAARGDDLNETIRRAIPAIGATNRVLRVLARNRQTLVDLSRDSGSVLKTFGERREDIGDFVTAARGLAETTADRRAQVAETFARFPGFLDELTPTMVDLGTASRLQAPALADLRAAAPDVTALLRTLRPFNRALEPATESLGDASEEGLTAARESESLLELLAGLGEKSQEPANNAAIILSDLDDRSRAVEPDPDSPGGAGYTGLEAPLQYIFDQTLALNIFDARGYSLKLNINPDECSEFTDADAANADRERYERCNQNLGDNQPGITTPDPSPPDPEAGGGLPLPRERSAQRDASDGPDAPSSGTPDAPSGGDEPGLLDDTLGDTPVQQLLDELPELLDPLKGGLDRAGNLPKGLTNKKPGRRPGKGKGNGGNGNGGGSAGGNAGESAQDLLDFLLSP